MIRWKMFLLESLKMMKWMMMMKMRMNHLTAMTIKKTTATKRMVPLWYQLNHRFGTLIDKITIMYNYYYINANKSIT